MLPSAWTIGREWAAAFRTPSVAGGSLVAFGDGTDAGADVGTTMSGLAARLIGSVLAMGLLAGCGGIASAAGGVGVAATPGPARALPPGYFGINYDYGGASIYTADADVAGQLAALQPGTLRWPAGTGANYFQWGQGYPVAVSSGGTGQCAPPPEREVDGFQFTLADLAAAYRRTGASPIFDLNVMSAGLADQIQMLRTARDVDKLPIKYVELGNEFYLCNTDYVQAFPTAQDYGRNVAADVRTLHADFPGVTVAAVGSAQSGQPRAAGWNAGLLAAATGTGKPDVITLHDHPKFADSLTEAELPGLFAQAYSSARNVDEAAGKLAGIPTWITEYSLSEQPTPADPAQRTYANALFEPAAAILLTQSVPDATLLDYWSSFGPNLNYTDTGTNPTVLTPMGLAMSWLDQAAHQAVKAVPIVFSGGPTLGSTGDSALVGESFITANGVASDLLVNLSGQAVTVPTGSAVPSRRHYRQANGDPVKQIPAATDLTTTSGTVGASITLAPYSLTVIG